MYSNKESVNILTALLVAHGVKHAVVCPGSRNAPIVHNLNECPDICCHPVTDERSAAFFALGIAQATDEPVVVCVTSGTALLNVAPAVAEAYYQHQSLIVISADRPAEWIGQLDGQTMQQPGVLAPWVAKTVNIAPLGPPEGGMSDNAPFFSPGGPRGGWHCNRQVNEALLEATADHRPCVHINVPLQEPLFDFSVPQLPVERVIRRFSPVADYDCLPQPLVDDLLHAERPLIVFGQLSPRRFHYEGLDHLFSQVIVLHEALAPFTSVSHFEEVLASPDLVPSSLLPDFILHVGDAIVSKRLKHYLRQAADARCWRVSLTGQVEDTFQNLRGIVVGDAETVLQSLSNRMAKMKSRQAASQREYRRQWLHLLSRGGEHAEAFEPPYSQMAAVRLFEQQLQRVDYPFEVHYANSTAVRLANIYAQGHPVWCNRGVNGIEGSLSTAVGFAAAYRDSGAVFCVIGDLSFFYDQNALWNQHLPANLRILLLNNGRGAIFDTLPGLSQSAARFTLVAGQHTTTAEGICRQSHVDYQVVRDMDQLRQGLHWLLTAGSPRPLLLEVQTDADTDSQVLADYFQSLR